MISDQNELTSEEIERLNRRFYSADPPSYFRTRFNQLVLFAGRSEVVERLLEEGATFEGVSVRAAPATATSNPERLKEIARYVAIESELLLHHVAESLLRLYLAHEGFPPCPWLELSKVRRPRQLTKLLYERFGSDVSIAEGAERLAPVVLNRDIGNGPDTTAENLEDLMRHLVAHLNRYGPMYNAGKHGLAIDAGENMTRLGGPDDQPLLETRGPAIIYLALRRHPSGDIRWVRAATFVRPARAMALTGLAVLALESLWSSVRKRYSGDGPVRLFEMHRSVAEALGERDTDGAEVRTVWGFAETIADREAGEGLVWELEVDFWGLSEEYLAELRSHEVHEPE